MIISAFFFFLQTCVVPLSVSHNPNNPALPSSLRTRRTVASLSPAPLHLEVLVSNLVANSMILLGNDSPAHNPYSGWTPLSANISNVF